MYSNIQLYILTKAEQYGKKPSLSRLQLVTIPLSKAIRIQNYAGKSVDASSKHQVLILHLTRIYV